MSPLAEWRSQLQAIAECVHVHICSPTDVASGISGLAHKVRALCHKLCLDHFSVACLVARLDSVQCICRGLGKEVGLPHFHCSAVLGLTPEWLRHPALQSDVEGASGAESEGLQHD